MVDSQCGATALVAYNHFISNKRESTNCVIENAPQNKENLINIKIKTPKKLTRTLTTNTV